jgi:hypothetical protein
LWRDDLDERPLNLIDARQPGKERSVYTADFQEVGQISWNPNSAGVLIANVGRNPYQISGEYLGSGGVVRT